VKEVCEGGSEEYFKNTPFTNHFFLSCWQHHDHRATSGASFHIQAPLDRTYCDHMFGHALKMLDPSLLALADPDDSHVHFLAVLVRMSALVRAGSEGLLLPRSLVAKLSEVAREGSAEAAFCLHWIAVCARA
jgi:hypothetical protein